MRTESGTAPPVTRASNSWSLGQGVESIGQFLQLFGAELPDPVQDVRAIHLDGLVRKGRGSGVGEIMINDIHGNCHAPTGALDDTLVPPEPFTKSGEELHSCF